jgi:hypothetical protein
VTAPAAPAVTGEVPVRRPPSATRGRYLLLIVVLLLGGASAGQITHRLVVGPDWVAVTAGCFRSAAETLPGADAAPARATLIDGCRAPVEHRLAWFAVGGALLVLAVALLLTVLLPRLMLRRLGARRRPHAPAASHHHPLRLGNMYRCSHLWPFFAGTR